MTFTLYFYLTLYLSLSFQGSIRSYIKERNTQLQHEENKNEAESIGRLNMTKKYLPGTTAVSNSSICLIFLKNMSLLFFNNKI